jgi:putative transposase
MQNALNTTATPQYRFGLHDRITIRDIAYRYDGTDVNGHVFRRDGDQHVAEWFSHEDIHQLLLSDALRVDRDWFLATKAKQRGRTGTIKLTDLPAKERDKVLWRQEFCDRFLRMEGQDRTVSRSDGSMRAAIAQISGDIAKIETARQTQSGRCGTIVSMLKPPRPTTLRDWLKRYEGAAFNPMVLCDRYGKSGNRTPRHSPDSLTFAETMAKRYANSNKPTKVMIYGEYQDELKKANQGRCAEGKKALEEISRRAFERLIDAVLLDYQAYAAREGVEAALKKFAIVRGGGMFTRPLERIEMDEWRVSLHTLVRTAGLWDTLSTKVQEAVDRSRVWLSAVIDTATECVLALRFLDSAPCSDSAIAAIEMAVSDKSRIAELIGTETPWDQHGLFETVAMDAGPAFIATATQAVIRDLGAEPFYPPAGLPYLRPRIERLFGTFQRHVIRYFPGQTFENVIAKGGYDSEGNACIDIEELNRVFVRYVVDAYHNTPHLGLAGETPRNAWLRLTAKWGVLPPPDVTTHRHIFGLHCERRIGNRGIRVLGLDYQSGELQRFRHSIGQKPAMVRINRFNLGAISVWTKDGWLTVPPADDTLQLDGVTCWEWVAAAENLRRRNADMARLSEDTVAAALASIRQTAEMAVARAELGSPVITGVALDKLDQDLFRTFGFAAHGPTPVEDPLGLNDTAGATDQPSDDFEDQTQFPANSNAPADPDDGFGGEDEWFTEE